MKKILALAILTTGFVLTSCNNATDGEADTDTTNFPADVHGDTTNNINTNTGTYPSDTANQGTSTQSSSSY